MGNIVFGFLLLAIGLIFLIFNKFVTELHIDSQELFGFHFDDRDRVIGRIIYIIVGAIFSAVGAIVLLGAFSFI